MISSTTNTKEREQWRARILRALAELDTTPPGLDRNRLRRDTEQDGTTNPTSEL
jgi:hypothetical protein